MSKKLSTNAIDKNTLANCAIPHNHVKVFNEPRKTDRRVKICGLANMYNSQVDKLAKTLADEFTRVIIAEIRSANCMVAI